MQSWHQSHKNAKINLQNTIKEDNTLRLQIQEFAKKRGILKSKIKDLKNVEVQTKLKCIHPILNFLLFSFPEVLLDIVNDYSTFNQCLSCFLWKPRNYKCCQNVKIQVVFESIGNAWMRNKTKQKSSYKYCLWSIKFKIAVL